MLLEIWDIFKEISFMLVPPLDSSLDVFKDISNSEEEMWSSQWTGSSDDTGAWRNGQRRQNSGPGPALASSPITGK